MTRRVEDEIGDRVRMTRHQLRMWLAKQLAQRCAAAAKHEASASCAAQGCGHVAACAHKRYVQVFRERFAFLATCSLMKLRQLRRTERDADRAAREQARRVDRRTAIAQRAIKP